LIGPRSFRTFAKNRFPARDALCRRRERGMALAVVMFCLLVLTSLSAAIILVTQTEIKTSSNYQLATQARYAAEAGAQRAANWLVYSYTPPSNFTSFDLTKYPVQYGGRPVVLSANNRVSSNYPDASMQQAFSAALLNQAVTGTHLNATTAVTATLLSMQPLTVFMDSTPRAVQTWQIASLGSIPGLQSVQVQVVTQMQNSGGTSVFQNAAVTTSNGCSSFVIGGNAKIDSFDSSAGVYLGTRQDSGGNLGSNGSIVVNSSGVKIYGNVVAAALTSLSCLLQAIEGLLSNAVGQLTGNFTHVNQPFAPPTPPAPNAPVITTTADIVNHCASISGCSAAPGNAGSFALAPGNYGNVVVSGTGSLHLGTGTYTVNSFKLSGGATLVVDSGPVVINVAGNSLLPGIAAVDFSGGNISNTTGVPADLQVVYGGSHAVNVSGAVGASLVVYAPNAQISLTGGGDMYGAFVALSIDDSGGSSIHYDRSLSNFVLSEGRFHTTSFSWSKF